MSTSHLIVFDLETGGLDPEIHPVTQFAAIAVDTEWNELDELELKIHFDPSRADPRALEMNSFDPDTWNAHAVMETEALGRISSWLGGHRHIEKVSKRGKPYSVSRVCGHNAARFDAPFLMEWFKRGGRFLPAAIFEPLDTLQLARWHYFTHPGEPQPENLKLETLARHLGIEHDAHDALGDVRATVAVARALCARST